MKKTIPMQHFNELKNSGSTVPRNKKDGEVIPFKVGKEYDIYNDENKEVVRARCTQDCPCHLIVVKAN